MKGNTFSLKFKKVEEKVNTQRKLVIPRRTQEFSMPSYQYIVQKPENILDVRKNLIDQEELLPVDTYDAENQTDELIPRPFLPYIPAKIGVDTGTQVEEDELRMLFDFDEEVKPLLEVLVTKTIEQALFELERETELLNIYYQTLQYQKEQEIEREEFRALEQQLIENKHRVKVEVEEKKRSVEEVRLLTLKAGCYVFGDQLVSSMPTDITNELIQNEWKPFVTGEAEEFLEEVYADVRNGLRRREESEETLKGKTS